MLYIVASSLLLLVIVAIQSYKHGILGTRLLLGWDSPGYVWLAQDLVKNGYLDMVSRWVFPQFYVLLLASISYLTGNFILVERFLPLFFAVLLVYADYGLAWKITKDSHVAGLAALLTVLCVGYLRLLSDLHRNLMAFSLATASFLFVPSLESGAVFKPKRFVVFVSILLIIAGTHFETYFILSVSLVLFACLTRKLRNLAVFTSACLVPVAALMLLFPAYFSSYMSLVVFLKSELSLSEIVLWAGGTLVGFLFVIGGVIVAFFKATADEDESALLVFSNSLVIFAFVIVVELTRAFSFDFALRTLLLLPVPILAALTVSGLKDLVKKRVSLELKLFSAKGVRLLRMPIRRFLVIIIVLILAASSSVAVIQNIDWFMTTYIPRIGYNKILTASEYIRENGLKEPVVVYYGESAIWFTSLYRNYFGAEIGEHFSYYGIVNNLLRLVPSKPKFEGHSILADREAYYSTIYYSELIGSSSDVPGFWGFSHHSYITSVDKLISHPIVVIAPEFYDDMVPYYLLPFHKGEGIYIVPPGSLEPVGETIYGSSISVQKNGVAEQVRSELLYIDPYDASRIILRVNASSGYSTYAFSDYPSGWTFVEIKQGDAISAPENAPLRLDATQAVEGNDPADSVDYWSASQDGILNIDSSSRKEGSSSLSIIGTTDFWGNLGVRYNMTEVLDLSIRPTLAVWAKANEDTTFSMTLHDMAGNTRTYWNIEAYGSSATAQWKRFVVDLGNYTSQIPDFDLSAVDSVDLYVSSTSGKQMSLWVDDLAVDDLPQIETTIFKARVLAGDTVVVYFTTKEGL